MEERVAVAARVDDPTGDAVELAARDARPHRGGRRRRWRREPGRRSSRNSGSGSRSGSPPGHPQRPGDVRAVALPNAADVEHDRVARLDRPIARLVVRRGRVRAGRDDGERRRVVTLVDKPLANLAADVCLRPPDQPTRGDAQHHPICGVGGGTEPLDLVRRLRHPQGRESPRWRARSRGRAAPAAAREGAAPRAPGRRGAAPPGPRQRPPAGPRRASRRRRSRPRQSTSTSPADAAGLAAAAIASRRGATSAVGPSAGSTSIVSRSSGWAV